MFAGDSWIRSSQLDKKEKIGRWLHQLNRRVFQDWQLVVLFGLGRYRRWWSINHCSHGSRRSWKLDGAVLGEWTSPWPWRQLWWSVLEETICQPPIKLWSALQPYRVWPLVLKKMMAIFNREVPYGSNICTDWWPHDSRSDGHTLGKTLIAKAMQPCIKQILIQAYKAHQTKKTLCMDKGNL